jgi:hypothetical protein
MLGKTTGSWIKALAIIEEHEKTTFTHNDCSAQARA